MERTSNSSIFGRLYLVIPWSCYTCTCTLKAESAKIYGKNYKRVNQSSVSAVREAFVVIVAEVSK